MGMRYEGPHQTQQQQTFESLYERVPYLERFYCESWTIVKVHTHGREGSPVPEPSPYIFSYTIDEIIGHFAHSLTGKGLSVLTNSTLHTYSLGLNSYKLSTAKYLTLWRTRCI